MKRLPLIGWCCGLVVVGWIGARADQVVLSKIMYHPPEGFPEYLEVINNTATPLDMADWKLRGGVNYDFQEFSEADPTRTFLRPFERFVLSSVDEAALRGAYGIAPAVRVYGPWTGSLDNGGSGSR